LLYKLKYLQEIRERNGMTRDALARIVYQDRSPRIIVEVEAGNRAVTEAVLKRYAAALGCTEHDLCGDGGRYIPKHGHGSFSGVYIETLCWSCSNAYGGGCPWFKNYTPVDGWTADETVVNESDIDIAASSFRVRECPLHCKGRIKARDSEYNKRNARIYA